MEKTFEDDAPNDIENPSTPLLTSLSLELESLSPISSKRSIYRVPQRIRIANEKAYSPQVVSIGPLHHGNEKFIQMEEHKKRFLSAHLQRTNNMGMEYYINIIKQKEAELRGCYAEYIGFSSDEFTKIALVDAIFIIEVLLRYCFDELRDEDDPIFNKPWMVDDIKPDMMLLENQLPFFILEDLFDPERIPVRFRNGERLSIIKLCRRFFNPQLYFKGTNDNLEQISSSKVEHFVDFLRKLYVPLEPKPRLGKPRTSNIPTIKELHRRGVKLVKASKNLFDINFDFSEGVLEIPELRISDGTEVTIRNLLAFEQCHCIDKYMTDYVVIMDSFVNTPEDVDLLVKYGIVENWIGDCSQVATLINKLGVGVNWNINSYYYAGISEELRTYCRTSWHKWRANLKQNYFHTPWAIVSVIAAVLLIMLTIIQAVCSVISVSVKDSPPP